jgi:hypothetical protein
MADAGLSDFSYSVCSAPLVCYPLLQFTQSESTPDIVPRCSLASLRLIGDQVNAGPRVYLFQG